MQKFPLFVVAALALIGPGLAAAEKAQAAAPERSALPQPDPLTERLSQAILLVQKRSFDAALAQYIEPTIAQFDKEYSGYPGHVYCARNPEEARLYMIQAAAKNQHAQAISSAYAFAYYLKGYILVDRNDFAGALPFLQKAADLSPSNAQFLSELGHVLQQSRQWQKSLEVFDRAIEGARLLSGNADHSAELRRALRGRGYCLIELQRYDEAEKVYAECLELDPNDGTAKGELAFIKERRANPAPAK